MRFFAGSKLWVTHLFLLVLLVVTGINTASSEPLYTVSRSVVASGGGNSSSTSYTIQSSLGQAVSGESNSSSYVLYAGFLLIPDSDGDSILDNTDNCVYMPNPSQLDSDADLIGDACEDSDNDGISDAIEAILGTNPLNSDTDGDGLDDFYEVGADTDITSYQPGVDTDPNNPDTDGDGLLDGSDPNPLIHDTVIPDGDLAPYGNPDGVINAADLLIAQRIALGVITPTTQDLLHGDLYPPGAPDGVINTSDLILIQQLVISQP